MTYAEEQKLHRNLIDDPDQDEREYATIHHQYNRFLLLLLLDPCHLQKGESRTCFNFLNTLAGHAVLSAPIPEAETTGHYVIDKLGEVSPYLLHPDALSNLSENRFILFDLTPVSKLLHQKLRQMERSEEGKPDAFMNLTMSEATSLLARLLKSWHIRLKRESERHATAGEVMVWIGIEAIYTYLTGKDLSIPTDDEIDITQLSSIQQTEASGPTYHFTATRNNQSRSGVALKISSSNPPLVGELLLYSAHPERKENDWKIGIVKRALKGEENRLEIGVQFILGKIEPITIRLTNQQHASQPIQDRAALYVNEGHIQRSSLVVPKHFFVIGNEYRIEEMIPSPEITPLQRLESTARFERYRIKNC
jgi:hypothetical protein